MDMRHLKVLNEGKDRPEVCFVLLPGSNEVVVVRRGESGYRVYDTENKLIGTPKLIRDMNEHVGVSLVHTEAMMVGSCFGWHVPGANPDNYFANGKFKEVGQHA